MQSILYQFFMPGYIPGFPTPFPGGTWAKIDPETNALLGTGPIAGYVPAESPTVDMPSAEALTPSENAVNSPLPTTGQGG